MRSRSEDQPPKPRAKAAFACANHTPSLLLSPVYFRGPFMHFRALRSAVVPALFFVAPLVAAACDEGNLPGNAVVRFQLQGDTPPNFLDVPFPTDAYLQNQ